MMQKVYFISGLGADERIFQYLNLEGIEPVFIQWLEPFSKEKIFICQMRQNTEGVLLLRNIRMSKV
jgi:hypothetical protein